MTVSKKTPRQTEERKDGRKNGRMDGRTDGLYFMEPFRQPPGVQKLKLATKTKKLQNPYCLDIGIRSSTATLAF